SFPTQIMIVSPTKKVTRAALCHNSFRTRCSSSAAHVLRMIAIHLGVPIDVSDVSPQITPVEMIDKLEEAIQRKIDSLVPSEERADFALEKV
ncbi:MAG: hypothetical protein WCG83_00690, partial [Candidatus Peregrinibacteria bacterium]